jgi:hypothetical protein
MSKAMKSKLPTADQGSPEELLWARSGGYCFLCEVEMNRSSDDLEVDHNVPEAEGGTTTIENLNLAHVRCNRAKRNAKTVPIKPYLKLVAFANQRRLKYDGFVEHFGITPSAVVITRADASATFELPDGSKFTTPVLSETNSVGTFEYVFLQLPRDAIFNDDACQPRALRLDHAWAIYSDLQRNVLHEPPSCRVASVTLGAPVKLLMFDGQHKTVANWMLGRTEVTTKVYLNLTDAQANELVNSIQAKIKKLPLSPFELAGKMSDEWENKFGEYENEVGSPVVSEKGFLAWLPTTERARGKLALQSALVQNILSRSDLRISKHVKKAGGAKGQVEITEQALKGKLIEKLLVLEARADTGESAQDRRDREADNIVYCLNVLNDLAFETREDAPELNPQEVERARRMTYQPALAYSAMLIRQLWFHIAKRAESKAQMTDVLSDVALGEVEQGIGRLVNHPAWTAPFGDSDRLKRLKSALERNQDLAGALEELGLDLSYLLVGDSTSAFKAAWGKDGSAV